jgi:hypothetical protein
MLMWLGLFNKIQKEHQILKWKNSVCKPMLIFTTGYEFLPLKQSLGIEFMEEDQTAG